MNTEQEIEAVNVAHRMARAAGKVTPEVMAAAAYMLISCACLAKDPSKYADLMAEREQMAKSKQPNTQLTGPAPAQQEQR